MTQKDISFYDFNYPIGCLVSKTVKDILPKEFKFERYNVNHYNTIKKHIKDDKYVRVV